MVSPNRGWHDAPLAEMIGEALGVANAVVANEADGSVRVVAEGPRATLDTLLERLADGPPAGWVERIIVRWEPARGIGSGFRIESGAHRGD